MKRFILLLSVLLTYTISITCQSMGVLKVVVNVAKSQSKVLARVQIPAALSQMTVTNAMREAAKLELNTNINSENKSMLKFGLATDICTHSRHALEPNPNLSCINSKLLDESGNIKMVTLIDEEALQIYKPSFNGDRIFAFEKYQLWTFHPEEGKILFRERTKNNKLENEKDSTKLIKMILGLSILSPKKYILLYKVNHNQFFRPAILPDIKSVILKNHFKNIYSSDIEIDNKIKSLFINNNYPWTSLGYTYDYSIPIGLKNWGISEFMLKTGTTIEIIDIIPLINFLRESPKYQIFSDVY